MRTSGTPSHCKALTGLRFQAIGQSGEAMNMQPAGFTHSWKVVASLPGDMTVSLMFIFRARLAFPHNGSGRAGVFIGNIFCCINIDTQQVELYQGSVLLGSYGSAYSKTPVSDIRTNPNMYLHRNEETRQPP